MTRILLLLLFTLLMGCPPILDDDDATADDDDTTLDDDDATADDDDDDDDDTTLDDDDATADDDDDATGDDDDDNATGDDDDATGTAPIPVELCVNTTSNPFVLNTWSISGDELTANVSYGGGCEVHDFRACWDFVFLESFPVQANLVIEDQGPPDPCQAYITETHMFDMTPIQTQWVSGYGPPPGEVIINLGGGSASYTF